jgi:hypothetical protein
LYTHGFLIISIISAVFGQQSAGAVPRRGAWRQNGEKLETGESYRATSPFSESLYESET